MVTSKSSVSWDVRGFGSRSSHKIREMSRAMRNNDERILLGCTEFDLTSEEGKIPLDRPRDKIDAQAQQEEGGGARTKKNPKLTFLSPDPA